MHPFLNIITAVSRPQNLYVIKSIIKQELLPYFNTTWYCVYDPRYEFEIIDHPEPWIISFTGGIPNDISGASQRNLALDQIKTGWINILDDDNVPFNGFGKIIRARIQERAHAEAFIFNQVTATGKLFAAPENIRMGHIDVAQILVKKEIIGKNKFFDNVYESDYYFIKRIHKRNENKFVFLNEDLCHYNFLKR